MAKHTGAWGKLSLHLVSGRPHGLESNFFHLKHSIRSSINYALTGVTTVLKEVLPIISILALRGFNLWH